MHCTISGSITMVGDGRVGERADMSVKAGLPSDHFYVQECESQCCAHLVHTLTTVVGSQRAYGEYVFWYICR